MFKSTWKDEFYVRAYEAARMGLSNTQIIKYLGISQPTFNKWLSEKPAFKESIEKGRSPDTGRGQTFREYVYQQLPPELKKLWDKIHSIDREKNGVQRIEALLSNAGKLVRQQLFVHALVHGNFNLSEACRTVNISKRRFDVWKYSDPDFLELFDEIEWHKKNFFEGSLIQKAREGDIAAILYGNRCLNKDRGYVEKQVIEHTGQINHAHAHVSIEELDLPTDTRRELLNALRTKAKLLPSPNGNGTHTTNGNGTPDIIDT